MQEAIKAQWSTRQLAAEVQTLESAKKPEDIIRDPYVLEFLVLKCFVLIDLKVVNLTHPDLGQMQMYVHYYERELMNERDNLSMLVSE